MIIPAQQPNAGRPASTRLRTGSIRSNATASFQIVVDSPPGMTRPSTSSSCSGLRTGTAAGARGGQGAQVLGDVALQREHADERPGASAGRGRIAVPRHQPRPA